MGRLFDTILKRFVNKGRTTDIELPNESGMVDSRLPKHMPMHRKMPKKEETAAEKNKRFRDENRRAAGR